MPAAAHEIEIVTQSPEPGAQVTTKVYAAGICCASEVRVIHDMLDRFPGVLEVSSTKETPDAADVIMNLVLDFTFVIIETRRVAVNVFALQVDVGVLTKMVTIKHTSAVNDMTLIARLNEAHLEASLEPVRENKGIKAAWIPKWNGEFTD